MAVFRKTTHSTFVAWLALLAVWLTVVMPVISRSLPMPGMAGMDMGAMPMQPLALGAWCDPHGGGAQPPSLPSDP